MQEVRPDMEQQVADLSGELRKVREEVADWKSLASASDATTIETLEAELDASREAEERMLESLALQTKQLEITKISLEEARLEISSLEETVQRLQASAVPATPRPRGRYDRDRDLQRVNGELRLSLAAEEKGKKAMEEMVLALKEVNAEMSAARQQLARAQHDAEAARLESDRLHLSVKRKDDRIRALTDEVARLRAEAEESFAAWTGKEVGFTACMKSTEAELESSRRENERLLEQQRSRRDEVAKLRDILKQAVKDTKFVKEALEEARGENAVLKEIVGSKDNAVKCTKEELECLRVTEAAARDSVKELQSLLVATSSSPTAASGRSFEIMEDVSSPHSSIEVPGFDRPRLSDVARVKPPAGVRTRRMSEHYEGSVHDIFNFGSFDDQKSEVGVFTSMPRLPGRRRVVMRKVGNLFRWKSFANK